MCKKALIALAIACEVVVGAIACTIPAVMEHRISQVDECLKSAGDSMASILIKAQSGECRESTRDNWLSATIKAAKEADTPPDTGLVNLPPTLTLFSDGYFFVNNTKPLRFSYNNASIEIPRGFVTDLASIPWIVQPLVPKEGPHSTPAISHDFLYWDHQCERGQADALLLREMEDANVGVLRRWLIYIGVRLGGWWAWSENDDIRKDQLRRVIPEKIIPCSGNRFCNPYQTWEALQLELHKEGYVPTRQHPPTFCNVSETAKDENHS